MGFLETVFWAFSDASKICMYMAFQKGTQTAPQGGTVPPQGGM